MLHHHFVSLLRKWFLDLGMLDNVGPTVVLDDLFLSLLYFSQLLLQLADLLVQAGDFHPSDSVRGRVVQ